MEEKKEKVKMGKKINPMREVKLDKVVLHIGANGENLTKAVKLLEFLTDRKPCKTSSKKRIPSLGVRPGLEIGAVITIRKSPEELLKKMLIAIDNQLKKKQISVNNFSFGIHEYIEIPGIEYQRDIGIMGLDVTVVFKRAGRRVGLKKVKRGKVSKRQTISQEEIIKFMEEHFQTQFK